MRLLLVLAVLALGADALLYNGAYTQSAWRKVSQETERLVGGSEATATDADRKVDRRS